MVRVLLVFEDFNEVTLTETYLRRIGFDVVSITNEILLHDQVLSFNPDVVVAFGKNSRVSSFSIGQKMKDNNRYHSKVIIVVPKDVRPSPDEILRMKMDAILEAPMDPEKLVQTLCKVTGHSPTLYLDKLTKARLSGDADLGKRPFMVNGGGAENAASNPGGKASEANEVVHAPLNDPERIKKYEKFTKNSNFDIQQSTHERNAVKKLQKDLKKDWDFDKLDEQDRLKREFAEALFKKKSEK